MTKKLLLSSTYEIEPRLLKCCLLLFFLHWYNLIIINILHLLHIWALHDRQNFLRRAPIVHVGSDLTVPAHVAFPFFFILQHQHFSLALLDLSSSTSIILYHLCILVLQYSPLHVLANWVRADGQPTEKVNGRRVKPTIVLEFLESYHAVAMLVHFVRCLL